MNYNSFFKKRVVFIDFHLEAEDGVLGGIGGGVDQLVQPVLVDQVADAPVRHVEPVQFKLLVLFVLGNFFEDFRRSKLTDYYMVA